MKDLLPELEGQLHERWNVALQELLEFSSVAVLRQSILTQNMLRDLPHLKHQT